MKRLNHKSRSWNQKTEKTERNRIICELRRNGLTNEEIGRRFGITMQMVSKIWIRDNLKYLEKQDGQ